MKKQLLTTFLSFMTLALISQITVTENNIAGVGDVIYESIDTMPNNMFSPGSAGANQTWDFSTVQAHVSDTTTLIDPAGTPYANLYPTATACIYDDSSYVYIQKSSTGMIMLGENNEQMSFTLLPLPLTYGATHIDGPIIVYDTTMFNDMLDSTIVQMYTGGSISNIDSIAQVVSMEINYEVDAYGSLSIPSGTYDALRLKQTQVMTMKLDAYYNNAWQPMPNTIAQLMGMPGPVLIDTMGSGYQWWTDQNHMKFMAAQMDVDSNGMAESITYNINANTSSVAELGKAEFNIYPNPASESILIELNESKEGLNFNIFAVNGQIVLNGELDASRMIDISKLENGQYILELGNEGQYTRSTFSKL